MEPIVVSGRTKCAGAISSVETNLTGSAADQLEDLQAKYEDLDGFRAVVFDGQQVVVVVSPESIDAWGSLSISDLKVYPSCVPSSLANATKQAVDNMDPGPGGFSSVGYDALSDTMTVITTAPSAAVVQAIRAIEPTAVDADLIGGAVRITQVMPGDFGGASRGADTSPFWGGATILTDIGACTSGFYLNSAVNGTVMATAGHCFGGNGKSTWNGNHTAVVGTSEGRSRPDPDLALIDGQSYDHYSYSWNDQTTHKVISAASNPTTGVAYCEMGAVSLRRCSAYSALDVDANYLGGVTHHLAYTSNPAGPSCYLGQEGDSGGGVYRELSDGTLGARGLVVAVGSDANSCARWDHKLQTITTFYSAAVVITP